MRVLRCRQLLLLLLKPPDGDGTKEDTIYGDGSDPDVDEARREVVSKRTQGAPSLCVAAKIVARGVGGEIVAAQLLLWSVAGERPGVQQHLLLAVRIHDCDPALLFFGRACEVVTACSSSAYRWMKLRRNDDVEEAAVSRSVTQGALTRQKGPMRRRGAREFGD